MFVTYLIIGIFLILIGLLSACYFLKLLKNHGFNIITLSSLNECIITIFIGIFYIFCTAMITTTTTPTNQHEILAGVTTDNDVFIIQEPTEIPPITTELSTLQSGDIPDSNTTTTTIVSNDIGEFLTNYQNLMHNLIQQQRKSRQFDFNKSSHNQTNNQQQCINESLMENSMFLYSYLHCVLSLILSIVEQNNNRKSKLIMKILLKSFLPILTVLLMNLTTNFEFPSNLHNQNSTIFDIIHQPINITTIQHTNEVNDIISNIYRIVKSITNQTQIRQPKSMETCPISRTQKVVISLTILLYFIAIFHIKIQQIKQKQQHKQYNLCLFSFSLLWLPTILNQFVKNFFYDSYTSDILSDIFLTLGNLNRLTIVIICYMNGKNVIKRLNSVQPDT